MSRVYEIFWLKEVTDDESLGVPFTGTGRLLIEKFVIATGGM